MSSVAGRGGLNVVPTRKARLVIALAAVWLASLLALGAWWALFALRQADRIATLERGQGLLNAAEGGQWARTHQMLWWEGGTFLVLLILLTAVLAWLYSRDHLRTRALQAFFASVTHELKTPLTSIRLQAEALAAGGDTPTLVRRLLSDTGRLESQVESALELARLEGGGALVDQTVPLGLWLERAIHWLGEVYGAAVQFHVEVKAQPDAVAADAAALQIILRNLVENSVRHGQTVPVMVDLTIERNADVITFIYRDHGKGFAEGDAARLGQLFRRGKRSSGAGVGLYLVRLLMTRMGGWARFESAPGEGFSAVLGFRSAEA
ncbi:MAG TPA: HAMP domain-containing sensor histidine kinase [Steroidobacteraceae bacterium]|jgi:signal transduction histidine kinase